MTTPGTVTWARKSGGGVRSNPSLSPAIELFDKVMDPLAYNNIGIADLIGENGLNIMADFCTRIGNNPPIGKNTGKPMAASSLIKYIEALCKELRNKFGRLPQFTNAPLFPTDDVNSLKKTFEDHHGRTLIVVGAEDEDALLRDYYPIPREHSPRTKLLPLHDFSNPNQLNHARSVDLLGIGKRLLRTCQFVNWLLVLVTNNAVGCGGEAKFLSYDKMFWDCYFCMLFFQWFQRKELKTSPSAFVYDFSHPELCVLFAFGCYWALEDGLVRSAESLADLGSPQYRQTKFVFQHLHTMVDVSVATSLTNIIRSCVHGSIQSHYTVKSLRAGAMSMLSWLPTVTYEECIAVGGWPTKASRDWCVWQYLVAIIPAVLALAGHPDPRLLPYAPTCDVLFADRDPEKVFPVADFESFMTTLFPNNLPEFMQQGRLRPFMNVVVAVMIKNFRYMQDTYGSDHLYVNKMRTVAIKVGLAKDLHEASNKLRYWSKKIIDDIAGANQDDSGVLVRPTVSDKLHELSHNVADLLRSRQQDQLNQVLALQGINELKQGQADIKVSVDGLTEAIRQLTTLLQSSGISVATTITPQQQQQHQQVQRQGPQHPNPPQQPATNNNTTNTTPTQRGRGSRSDDRRIRNILSTLYEDNQFTCLRINVALRSMVNLVNTRFMGGDSRNITKTEAALNLVDCLWTPEERLNCINQGFANQAAATQAFIAIDDRVKRTCHVFDDPGDKWEPDSRRSTAVTGVGNIILKRGREHFQQQIKYRMPKWNRTPPTIAGNTLWDHVVQKESAIKARVRSGNEQNG